MTKKEIKTLLLNNLNPDSLEQPINLPVSKRTYELVEDYVYSWYNKDKTILSVIIVPAGFRYDGASIPRWLWSLSGLIPDGLIRAAALVHDYIYFYEGKLPAGSMVSIKAEEVNKLLSGKDFKFQTIRGRWKRSDCDKLFRKMMIIAGISKSKAKRAYYSVRIAGFYFWRSFK